MTRPARYLTIYTGGVAGGFALGFLVALALTRDTRTDAELAASLDTQALAVELEHRACEQAGLGCEPATRTRD